MPKASIATRAQRSHRGWLPSLDREGARNHTEQFSDQSIGSVKAQEHDLLYALSLPRVKAGSRQSK
jgi:hypothetical protein